MLAIRNSAAEEVAEEGETGTPQDAARDVVGEKCGIAHPADAGEDRREGAHDGYESREHYGACAMFGVEQLRALKMPFVEEQRIFAREERRADLRAKPIPGLIAEDRSQRQERDKEPDVEQAAPRKQSGREQQAVAREEKTEEEPRFREHDAKKSGIAGGRDQVRNIDME